MSSDIGTYGESLYQQVLPLHGPDPDGLAHSYIGAISHPMREIDELVRDTPQGTGWSIILDADAAPVKGLWWLAQLAGVKLRQRKTIYRRNLATYPDWEPVTVRWDPSPGHSTVARVAGHNRGHSWQGKMTALDGTSDVFVQYQESLPIVAGKEYTVSLDVTAQDTETNLIMQWYNGVTFIDSVVGATHFAADRHSVTLTAPPDADTLLVLLYMASNVTGDTVSFDALAVRRTDEENPDEYVAGDQPGGAWTGTAHASPSTVGRLETDDEWGAYARDAIKRQGGKKRGTPDAIISAAQDTLLGQKVARLLERVGGNAYALELVTRPSETPDSAATLAAATTQKPAGMSLVLTLTEDLLIDEDTGDIDSATGTIDVPT